MFDSCGQLRIVQQYSHFGIQIGGSAVEVEGTDIEGLSVNYQGLGMNGKGRRVLFQSWIALNQLPFDGRVGFEFIDFYTGL